MEFDDVVNGRRSIRGFKDELVPKDVLREIVALASRAPSSQNTQPWHLHLVSGEPLNRIRAGNTERNLAGVPASREIRMHRGYEGKHRERQKRIAAQLFEAMDIEWSDKERRKELERKETLD